jgi:hypothetical protein
MAWHPNPKEIDALVAQDAPKRYSYWIKKTCDTETVWSLWHEGGWALASDPVGSATVPVWPHSAFAALCATGQWTGYQPKAIPLDMWLERWIPGMTKDRRGVAVFPTAADKGVIVAPARIASDLSAELENYD